jgi:molecular chaperone DnaJ
MSKDYYQILGVDRSASKEDIKKAYRRLAHKHHPDKANGNEEKFKEVNEAYQVLSDSSKRTQYDQFGANFEQAGNGFGGFSGFNTSDFGGINDIFEQFFRGQAGHARSHVRRGEDIAIDLAISFEESAQGVNREFNLRTHQACSRCRGNGAEPGTKIENCRTCQGTGEVHSTRQTMFGAFSQASVCPDCHGEGKKATQTCHQCRGEGRELKDRKLEVKIPAGISDGQTIEISGQGEYPARGGIPGNLYATIHVNPHPVLKRDHRDIRLSQKISFVDAALGTTLKVPTLTGHKELKVPAGTQPGTELRLEGIGFPNIHGSSRGDEIVTINIEIPRKLSRKQKDLLQQFQSSKSQKTHRIW